MELMSSEMGFKEETRKQKINGVLLILVFVAPSLLTVIIGWRFDFENEYIDEYFISTPIVTLPILISIGRNKTAKWIVYLLVVSGYTFGLLLSTCFIDKSNLWPFSIIAGPVTSIPAVVFYFVIIDFIERCKSDPNLKW